MIKWSQHQKKQLNQTRMWVTIFISSPFSFLFSVLGLSCVGTFQTTLVFSSPPPPKKKKKKPAGISLPCTIIKFTNQLATATLFTLLQNFSSATFARVMGLYTCITVAHCVSTPHSYSWEYHPKAVCEFAEHCVCKANVTPLPPSTPPSSPPPQSATTSHSHQPPPLPSPQLKTGHSPNLSITTPLSKPATTPSSQSVTTSHSHLIP